MTLAHPAWLLLLLLLPLFVTGAVLTARLRRKQWAAFSAGRLRPKLLRRGSPLPRWLAFGFLMISVALLAVGLARPQTTRGTETETSRGRNVMLALDLSRSMMVEDLKPDRLTQAKTLCYELIEALPNDRIGVIGFAGEAYPIAPLTIDHAAVRETISQLDMNFIPVGGSNLEGALEMAIEKLKETGQKENALILLTDGDETTGKMLELAAEAKSSGVYVFTIGFGTELGDFVPDKDFPDGHHRDRSGNVVRSVLETQALKRLSQETGGRFAVATSAANIPDMVTLAISDLDQFEIEGRERFVPVEYYQWFVLPGILFLIASVVAGTRWRGLGPVGAAAALLALAPPPLRAGLEADARRALADKQPAEAAILFDRLANEEGNPDKAARYRLAQANSAYSSGDLDGARHAFSEALRSDDPQVRAAAHHGLGTLLFNHGWAQLAKGAVYPEIAAPAEKDPNDPFSRISDALLGMPKEDTEGAEATDPMAAFDGMVRESLAEWMQGEAAENGESDGFRRFGNVLSDWIDGVKHFDTAVHYDPSLQDAAHNRELTVKYLKKLKEILEEVNENAENMQQVPQPGPEEGEEPQPEGDGEGDEKGDGEGNDGPKKKGNNGDEEKDDGKGGDRPDDKPEESDKDGGNKPKPGETPEDTARRILRENADFEKGALTPGRLHYRQPEKDW
ncbi:VWA domain-containing protein [Luteolibacter marinus]|uniref:VWA domain-containing protein n=1 Tax=Luteolibacter marinus TaxID=2776705 RepID=UPI001867DB4A|nr:VWA domain-containing protein [Luteolibacter marinus]